VSGERTRGRLGRAENRLRLLRAYLGGAEPGGASPPVAYIESTSRCNLACPMCARQLADERWRDEDMPVDLFARSLEALGPGCELVLPFAGGEPLLHPRIAELVALCKASGRSTELATNATLLDGRASRDLIRAGLDLLVVSLDAATAATYGQLRGGADHERTCRNVMAFLRAKGELGARTWVVVQMIALPENAREMAEFRRQWGRVGGVDAVRVKADEVHTGKAGAAPRPPGSRRGPCHFLWMGPAMVRYDGAVYPCCHSWRAEPVGQIREQGLAEIWNGPAMAAMRRAHLAGRSAELAACRTCQAVEPRRLLAAASLLAPPGLVRRAIPTAEVANRLVGRWLIRA